MSEWDPEWQQLISLLAQSTADNHQQELLQLLLTPDERDALVMRVKIVRALMHEQISQRQLKERLGVGIATITRGSNGLKTISPAFRQWLIQQLPDYSTETE